MPSAPLQTLRQKALQLLARREYGRQELQRKLRNHAPPADDIDAAGGVGDELSALLDEFESKGLLSDARYAESRVRTRGQRYGNQRLRQELTQQAIDPEVIEAALASTLISCGSEYERAQRQWQKKFGAAPVNLQELARQQRFLAYRGFSSAIIRSVLERAGKSAPDFSADNEKGSADEPF